ncbi:response regulator transcription factor [Microbacterium halotolerans]|uniref:response regulator transcription factor n=1 Tax=Microbacterium halotolerans TaxID=246613 RepID=UPI0013C2DF1B|nr:response regulator transcription factor [Microbacterium halotolerans]
MRRKIAIVEDHLLQRRYTEALLTSQSDLKVVFSGETLPEFVGWSRDRPPERRAELLILDLMVDHRPSADPATVRRITASGIHVIVFSALASPPLVRRMLRSGVSGVIGKRDSESDILTAVRTVLSGRQSMSAELASVIAQDPTRPVLSDQEERALVLYATGLPLYAVAESIGVRPDTAKKYLQRVKTKYTNAGRPVSSRLDLSRAAADDGYLDLPEAQGLREEQ